MEVLTIEELTMEECILEEWTTEEWTMEEYGPFCTWTLQGMKHERMKYNQGSKTI